MQNSVQLNIQKDMLKPTEMAELLDVSRSQVYNLVRKEQIPYVIIGSRIRFLKSQIEAWLAEGGSKEA